LSPAALALPLGIVLASALGMGIVLAWNRALRRKVQARTLELALLLAEKERLAASLQDRERQLAEAQQIAQTGITERKLGEQALESEREQLRSIVSHAPVAMAILDRDLRYVAHSERWLKYWRLRGRTLLGHRHDELFPALPEAYRESLLQALEGKVVTRREDPFPLADGSSVYIRWTMHPWRRTGRRVDGVVVVVQNIDVLVRARESAREASRLKSELLANMSHEIRTPLSGVMGMTRLLIDTRLDRQQREYAEMIRDSGRALLDLINDILDFSKIEAGRLDLESIDCDLAVAVEDAVVGFAERSATKGLELVVAVDPEVPRRLRGDPGRLLQILNNLLANAVKFTDRGQVVVRASVAEEWEDEVVVRFTVTDSGIGVPAEAAARLFQPFNQGDSSTTRRYGGTGLGLAISKRLAEMMGGGIGIEDGAGGGSTFWFTARLKRPEDSRAAAPERALPGRLALVAVANETLGQVLSRQLEAMGMIVRTAHDVKGARGTLEDESSDDIDLVVLDADLAGAELAALTREVRVRSKPARVLVLARIGAPAATEGPDAPDEVVTKPVRPSLLQQRLIALLSGEAAVTVSEPTGGHADEVDPHAPLILVVEDNDINRAVAVRSLERLGFRATAARNGAEAVEMFAPETFAAVLMDCQMPVMDGFEATAQLRAAEAGRPPTPILAMTAGALVGDRERCLAAGMDDYIAKPVAVEDLATVLRRWVPVGEGRPGGVPTSVPLAASLDARVLSELRGLDTPGSGFFHGMIGLFLASAPGRVEALATASQGGDAPAVRALAHGLRSTCGNVGATGMSDLCAQIEERAAEGSAARAPLLEALRAEFRLVQETLEAEQRRARPALPRASS
jgi:PAS domain S-box-containing protein